MSNPPGYQKSKIPVLESPYLASLGLLTNLSDEIFYGDVVASPQDILPGTFQRPILYNYGVPDTLVSPSKRPKVTFNVDGELSRKSHPDLKTSPRKKTTEGQEDNEPSKREGSGKSKRKKKKKPPDPKVLVEQKLDALIAKIEDEEKMSKLGVAPIKLSKSMENLKDPKDPLNPIPLKMDRKSASHPRVDKYDDKPERSLAKSEGKVPGGPTKVSKMSQEGNSAKYVKAGGKWRTSRSGEKLTPISTTIKSSVSPSKKRESSVSPSKKRESSPSKALAGKSVPSSVKPEGPRTSREKERLVKATNSEKKGKPESKKKKENEKEEKKEEGEVKKKGFTLKMIGERVRKQGNDSKDPPPKEVNIKDAAAILRLMSLLRKGDYHGLEQPLRYFEKVVLTGENSKPLEGVAEEVTGWTPLMYAIKDNRTPFAERMLALGCDINAKNKEGETPLIIAATYARDETVRFLLFKKADTSAATETKKETALHMACKRPSGNGTNILKSLIHVAPKEARLVRDVNGNIPLIAALECGNKSACQQLLHHLGFDQMRIPAGAQKEFPLHLAIRKKDLEIAKLFVDAGANVDAKNSEGQTALHIACAMGDENMVKFFYMCKANPNIADKEDRTPIHVAAEHGFTSIIELLSDKFKVSVQRRTKDGSTLMHIASIHGHPETAMALFKKGVPLQMPNKGGARSLHIAARNGHGALISKLLEKGEKIDATTNDNYTALHIAVEYGKPSVVETLLGYGAQVHIKGGKAKETPLHIAARVNEGDKCAQMLLKSGADANITMENGETPLHVAARNGRLRIIRLLLNDGGDPVQKSNVGETPLHLACRYGHLQVIKVLLQFVHKERGEASMGLYINSATSTGESALHYASKLSREFPGKTILDDGREIATLLLNGGASTPQQTKETHETPFHYCAKEGNNEILKEMISRMTIAESQRALNKQSTKGWSPLLIACHKGHIEVVRTLLENSARVDVFDIEGRSALHLASEHGYQEVCGLLLNHKAYINAKSRIGFTALHYAAKKGYKKLCIFLIQDYSAYVDVVTLKKQTPLHLAAESGQIEVCRLLMGLRANTDAADEKGQKPIHLAAQNNHSDVIKLFLKHQSTLVTSSTKDGSTCAHLAAMQGSIYVLEELMKFDKNGVISARNRTTDATALQLASEGGHAGLVKSLLDAGASATDENKAGYAAIHSAAKNGHLNVIEALRNAEGIQLTSKKLGLNALHIAAYFGQSETVRELLAYISGTTPSEPPVSLQTSFLKELGLESGFTPLHLGAFSGEENVVRLLLNYPGVQVDAPTVNFGYNPLHLACLGGHVTVVGLLLSRSSDLLESKDKSGKTGLHLAADKGHLQMCEILLGQGAEIDAVDKENWTPLHCAAQAGHLEVIKLLVESGASSLSKNAKGQSPIWFATAENHQPALMYLMRKDHDTYGLMEDRTFIFNLTVCGKNNDNEPLDLFILSSPAPVEVAAKLSATLDAISTKEKERAKDLIAASKHCEMMTAELLALASGAESAGKVLRSVDRHNVEFLDVLIENEQKEVIAHTVVQRYLQELWVGELTWESWKKLLLFLFFIICPPIWVIFSLPLGHKYYKIPIIKFMSYLTSHIYLMILLSLTSITPIYPVFPIRSNLFPHWYEWMLLTWLLGLIVSEVTNPSDKGGLGWIKVTVVFFCILAVIVHVVGFFLSSKAWNGTLLYSRNQLFAVGVLLACVQILDFLSFHYLFGPWAIIIGNLMKDLARFLAVLAIFMVGFSMVVAALNHPFYARIPDPERTAKLLTNGLPSGVLVTPLDSFELLFFALFGLTTVAELRIESAHPEWTLILFKIFFGIYMLVSVVVLINLLIAMMSDTYQRIQAQSDIEWKFGLAKLIRNMHRTSATPSPINIFTAWFIWLLTKFQFNKEPINPLKLEMKGMSRGGAAAFNFNKQTNVSKWKGAFAKNSSQVTPKVTDLMRLSAAQGSPVTPATPMHGAIGSNGSLGTNQRIETVCDWPLIAKKYRALVGKEEHVEVQIKEDEKGEGKAVGSTTTLKTNSNYNMQHGT